MSSFRIIPVLILLVLFSTPPADLYAADILYNKYNIHTYDNGHDIRASYANWTDTGRGHGIIPPNTPIIIKKWPRGFIIHTQNTNKTIYFLYDTGRMRMSKPEYIRTITSPAPVSLNHLSPLDLEGVKQGRALIAMSKQGVLTALGYPAQHRTPSLESPEWTYWKNRFATLVVIFSQDGRVSFIQE